VRDQPDRFTVGQTGGLAGERDDQRAGEPVRGLTRPYGAGHGDNELGRRKIRAALSQLTPARLQTLGQRHVRQHALITFALLAIDLGERLHGGPCLGRFDGLLDHLRAGVVVECGSTSLIEVASAISVTVTKYVRSGSGMSFLLSALGAPHQCATTATTRNARCPGQRGPRATTAKSAVDYASIHLLEAKLLSSVRATASALAWADVGDQRRERRGNACRRPAAADAARGAA